MATVVNMISTRMVIILMSTKMITGEPPHCHRGHDDHLEQHRGHPHCHLEKPPRCKQGRSMWGSRGGSRGEERKSTWDFTLLSYLQLFHFRLCGRVSKPQFLTLKCRNDMLSSTKCFMPHLGRCW